MSEYARTIAALDDDYSAVGGILGRPFISRAADRVASQHRFGGRLYHPKREPWQHERLVDQVALHATEDDLLFPESLGGLAYEGATRRKLRIARDALNGFPVRYWTVNDEIYDRPPEGKVGIFITILMPLEWTWHGPMSCAYDTVIHTSWDDLPSGPACSGGSSHVLGPAAIKRLDVLSMDSWFVCERCGAWRPRECMVDSDRWFLDDVVLRDEYQPRWTCRKVNNEGWCR